MESPAQPAPCDAAPAEMWAAANREYLEARQCLNIDDADTFVRMRASKARLEHAFSVLKDQAEPGNPDVWHAISEALQHTFLAQDQAEPRHYWLRKAAQGGHLRAMVLLAHFLQRERLPEDMEEAVVWLRKAAAQGHASAMVSLGFVFREGMGVAEDYPQACRWFEAAADAGYESAVVHLGRMYMCFMKQNGENHAKALEWYLKGGRAGMKDAFFPLAMLYDDRSFSAFDPAEAVKWWRRLADTGNASAVRGMVALARHYRDGIGVEQDRGMALFWAGKAAAMESGPKDLRREAMKLLEDLENTLF